MKSHLLCEKMLHCEVKKMLQKYPRKKNGLKPDIIKSHIYLCKQNVVAEENFLLIESK